MCGITGIWTTEPDREKTRREVADAVAALRHRGPDDSGIWMDDPGIALGHTRLAILDLSDRGHQPKASPDGRLVTVYNGEVYNFAEIRKDLIALGHSFAGTGDTEVILAAFREWGPAAFDRMIGMFAIALWDRQQRRLDLFRDRIGVKPLYFGWDGKVLCFGSELKALRAYRHWRPEVDTRALGEFFQFGYIAGDRSIYRGVYKLRAGHHLALREGEQPVIEPFWTLPDRVRAGRPADDAAIETELEELLIDSFRYRMVSDVPVGVYLSGGIDSSLVTAVLARHHDNEIRTFTIGFSEGTHDESKWAAKVAKHCGTTHTEYILDVAEAVELAKDWGTLFDEPFADASGIPTLLVSRLAGEEVKVVLSADGGDELFSGYQVYSSVLDRLQMFERIPSWLGRPLSSALTHVVPSRLDLSKAGRAATAGLIRGAPSRRLYRLAFMLGHPTVGQLKDVYLDYFSPGEVAGLVGSYECPRVNADAYAGSAVHRMSMQDFHDYLPEDIMTKVDRTTMAVSIEGREPLLDHRLAEFAFSLPDHLRRGALGPKHMLKKILYRYVPRELVERPKQGFAVPLERWLKTDLRALVRDLLAERRIRDAGIMDPKLVTQVVDRFYRGDDTLGSPIWSLLSFEMWRERWC